MKTESWYRFMCRSCGWETPGFYNFTGQRPDLDRACPDSDCPKCGSHDSVVDMGEEVPPPADIPCVIHDINSGPYAR